MDDHIILFTKNSMDYSQDGEGGRERLESPLLMIHALIITFMKPVQTSLRYNEILRCSEKGEKQPMQRKKW